ncbi:MAG: flagellar basal-body MS-ring/collar protein FliF [Gemmatimonadota bacterium]
MIELIQRIGGWRRAATFVVGAGAVALIYGVSKWATAPAWVPMSTNLPLETGAIVTDRLQQAGIPYRLERGGSDVMVAVGDLARARVAVARDGLPTAGRPGLELFDKPSYAMTDFTQRINYRRALEGELERTIGQMRGVEGAQVHLAIHETSTFRRADSPSEASVVLRLRRGETPAQDVVRGIAQLVASSVDGLDAERVTIVDDAGRLLSQPDNVQSPVGLTSRQLAIQREVEEHFRNKAESIVSEIVGAGNARVQVTAAMNFDRIERTTQSVDPDRQVTATEQKAEIVPGAQGGAASTNQATTFENSRSTETYAGTVGSIRRLTVAVLLNEKRVPAGDSARYEPRTGAELARVDSLVRNAVGLDSTRGDQLAVVSVPFVIPPPLPVDSVVAPTFVQKVVDNQRMVINSVALLFAFVIGFLALKAIRSYPSTAAQRLEGAAQFPLAAGGRGGAAAPALPAPERFDNRSNDFAVSDPSRVVSMMPELAAMQANQETRGRAAATVERQPEVAAKLIRAWMKEA